MALIVIDKISEDLQGRTGTGFRNNALDTVETKFTLELESRIDLSVQVGVLKSGNTFSLTSGSWSELIAAFNGANIDFRLNKPNGSNPTISTTVSSVSGVDITLADDGGYADGGYTIGFFEITSSPEQFEFFVNLVPNAVGNGIASLIDSNTQRFSVVMNNSLTPVSGTDEFIQLGNKSGGSQFDTKTISRLADAANGNKQYELIVVYKNWVCINNNSYFASSAVGEYYEFQAFMINGDPSVLVQGTDFQNGDTGFESENFNGKPNAYDFVSIAWEDDSANTMDAFDYSQNSNFTITIDSTLLNLADTFNFKMFTLPNDATEYQNLPNPIENNLRLAINPTLIADSTPTLVTGNLDDGGAGFNIVGLNFAVTAGVNVIVTGQVVPNDEFKALYAQRDISDRKYKIWIQCEDSTLGFKTANTVNVLADFDDAQENIQPLGKLGTVTTLEMEDHNNDVYGGTPDPYLEDDARVNVEFTLPKDINTNPFLNIKMRVVAEKTDGERFTLEETIYDVSGLPPDPVTGIIPLDFTQNRGFKLPATSDKQDITVQLFPSLDTGGVFGVQVLYPFIVRYENWLPMPQASNDFFTANSQNWFPYSNNPNWNVQFEMGIETANGEFIDDLIFTIHDYDDWGEVPGSSFDLKKLDLTPITKPFSDEVVFITATHEIDAEDWNGNEWGLIHVRPENGAPQWLIGSVLVHSDANNPLIPLSGETEGKITVGTKIVTIEAAFDPFKDIDLTGDITFTSRISGSTTGGQKGNIFRETFSLASNPIIPQLRPQNTQEEDRGYEACCDPTLVLADLSDGDRNKNDVTSPRAKGDSVVFNLTKDGVATTYVPVSVVFPSQADAWYARIEWRDVLNLDGAGCYSIDIVATVAGNVQPSFNWGTFVLKPYEVDGYLHARYTARLLSEFNDVNDFEGIDYTGSFLLDSLRIFNGKFGYFDPNTEADYVEYLDGTNEKVKTEDFFQYELRVEGQTRCIINQLLTHVRGMTNCWMSSYNYDDFDYGDLSMKNVALLEGFDPEHKDGSRMINGTVKFKDKIFKKRAHFQDNRQTAEGDRPTDLAPIPTPTGGNSAMPLKTGQTISYEDDDDGFFEAGRDTSFLVLDWTNPIGNSLRFTDTLNGTSFANDVMIDWSSFDEVAGEVLGYYFGDMTVRTFTDYLADAVGLAIDGKSGWRPVNIREMGTLFRYDITNAFNYSPLNSFARFIWTNTIYFPNTSFAYRTDTNIGLFAPSARTGTNIGMAVRNYTLAELGL